MKQYIDIVKNVLENGKWKSPVRKNNNGEWEPVDGGVRTKALPNIVFSHEMSNGFPLLTTKKMAWKSIRVELEGFIRGITNKQWYQDRKCKIWDEWANPETVQEGLQHAADIDHPDLHYQGVDKFKKRLQKEGKDLGPIYGYQWRNFDQHYGKVELDTIENNNPDAVFDKINVLKSNGVLNGTDQFRNIVETLRTNPMDRRMVCSAWNPNQISQMALPPCHYSWNVTVIDNKVNLFWAQRSCDLMLGVPFNIASYALLLSLLAKDAGLEVGNLSGMLVDCHIYENQLEGAYEQITREPQPLPTISFSPNHANYSESNKIDKFNIFKWTYDNVELHNYNPLEQIKFGDVVV